MTQHWKCALILFSSPAQTQPIDQQHILVTYEKYEKTKLAATAAREHTQRNTQKMQRWINAMSNCVERQYFNAICLCGSHREKNEINNNHKIGIWHSQMYANALRMDAKKTPTNLEPPSKLSLWCRCAMRIHL